MEKIDTNPSKYVVFDVETNGLKSQQDDLLSISFYKPDDKREYSRFLPLELNSKVGTTHINGITEKDLAGTTALTQFEFDQIVEEYELEKRIILVYSGRNFDEAFLREYMKRHQISGFEKLKFYNIKNQVISPTTFSTGNITKDNLCALFGIEGVTAVHSGANDCKLEWQLFEKMGGYYYLVTEMGEEDNIFRLNDRYIIPVSLLSSHPKLSRILPARPYLQCESKVVKTFEISAEGVEKFQTNFTGVTLEHLINSMLNVDTQDPYPFLRANKMKLDFIGSIPNGKRIVPFEFNQDGTVTAIQKKDHDMEKRINSTGDRLKDRILPLISFIKYEIFNGERIMSQELVVDAENNFLAVCDLSSEKTVLEIKTNNYDSEKYKEQFFYEAKGRNIYHLRMNWVTSNDTMLPQKIVFQILLVDVHIGTPDSSSWSKGKLKERQIKKTAEIQKYLSSSNVSLVSYTNTSSPVKLQCKICEHEWAISYVTLKKRIPECPKCRQKSAGKQQVEISEDERKKLRAENYREKVLQKSNRTIVAINYTGARNTVDAICVVCKHEWKVRADHLIERCWCPVCKRM